MVLCTCGRIKSPEHIVFCRKSRQLQAQWPKFKPEPQNPKEYWTRLMNDPDKFATFLKVIRFYEQICINLGSS